MYEPRRPDGSGERTQKHKGKRRPRRYHRGPAQAARWEAAAARLDSARLAEGLQDPRTVADPVVAGVAPEAHDVPERRPLDRAPTQSTTDEGRR
jgi:hypothetical protein